MTQPRFRRRALMAWAAAAGCDAWSGAALAGPSAQTPRAERRAGSALRLSRHLFGSPIELVLPRGDMAAAEEVLVGLAGFNERWNAWKPGELQEVNQALRLGRTTLVPTDLRQVIVEATRLEVLSSGHFNPAIGALVQAWGFHADQLRPGRAPSAALVGHLVQARPSLSQLEWHGDRLRSASRSVQLDLGAYAKGVALEWALTRLQQLGAHDALLNLGGNLATCGDAGGRPWRVGIRDPFGPGLAASLETRGREAVETSGAYERWREVEGRRVNHIFDPRSGRSAADLASVTVVHADAAVADAGATALFAAGRARWMQIARRMDLQQVLVIDRDGGIAATPSMGERLRT